MFCILRSSLPLLLVLCSASCCIAAPVSTTLTLVPGSNLTLTVRLLGSISTSVNVPASGTQNLTLDSCDPLATTLSFDGGQLFADDNSFTFDLGALGSASASLIDVTLAALNTPGQIPLSYSGGTWNYQFDPADSTNSNTYSGVNGGLLTYQGSGPIALLLGSGTLDFSSDPLYFELPQGGELATLNQTLLGTSGGASTYGLTLTLPLSVNAQIVVPGLGVDAYFSGTIGATGSYVCVPEPSTVVLLAAALAGFLPLARRVVVKRSTDIDGPRAEPGERP
ncbi:MAG: PEP-CTERM sorting domain-containing protein [Pirellulales bacterium]|nr:PEP-CTERM sorting domain-containing protein [Pirellulales bacterium]